MYQTVIPSMADGSAPMNDIVKFAKTIAEKTILDRRLVRRVRTGFHFCLNAVGSILKYPSVRKSRKEIRGINKQMFGIAQDLRQPDTNQIPKIVHFVYGFKQSEELPFYAYMAIVSALHYNPGWKAVFHYHKEPFGAHWERLKPRLVLNQISDFSFFGIAPIQHYAHKADIVRLLALKQIGGAYLDIDTLTARSFEPLVEHEFVMGIQAHLNEQRGGLCNAAMLSKPNSRFVKRWLSKYAYFHSKGRDQLWDFHSVKLPALLSYSHPDEIKVLEHDAFFYPLWLDVDRVLLSEGSHRWMPHMRESFLFHLWNGFTENQINAIDGKYIMESKSIYAEIARPALRADT
jgi:hypothetical protein